MYTVQAFDAGSSTGVNAPTNGTITLTGGETDVTITDPGNAGFPASIHVGNTNPGGYGYLDILAGATVASINEAYYAGGYIYGGFFNLLVGEGAGSYGKVLVSGTNSALTTDGLAAGAIFGVAGGSGRLEVLSGASATFNTSAVEDVGGLLVGGYSNLRIGVGGGTGYALVSGSGATLIASGGAAKITVGQNGGTGELRIENGGFVGTFDFNVGNGNTPTYGTLVIDGAGSTLLASADYGYYGSKYAGSQGYLTIGRGTAGRGYLTVSNGGTFTTQNVDTVTDFPFMRFGRDNGSYGYGLITGAGSSLNVIQIGVVDEVNYYGLVGGAAIRVGDAGQGIVTVSYDAQINVIGDRANLQVSRGRYIPATLVKSASFLILS